MPAFYPGLYSKLYVPDPWQTTWVPRHFPEHHYPFENACHAISHTFGQVGHDFVDSVSGHPMLSPRIDTQESMKTFYIDVELPGLESEDKMKLRWISSRTLLVKAVVERKGTPEDEVAPKEDCVGPPQPDAAVAAQELETDNKDQINGSKEEKEPAVYLTLGERHLGLYGRAFDFPVDVDHEKTTAELKAGMLRITVPKVKEVRKFETLVSVDNKGK